MAKLLIFDDELGHWGPMTDRRACFEVRTGVLRPWQRIERAVGQSAAGLWVPERLREATGARWEGLGVNERPGEGQWLVVNGRWNGVRHAERVASLEAGQGLVDADGQVVAARLGGRAAGAFLEARDWTLPQEAEEAELEGAVLMDRPWHVLNELGEALGADLEALELPGVGRGESSRVTVLGEHPAKMAADVRVLGAVVINTEGGPVAVDAGAVVHPFAVLEGPCYVGPGSVVRPHAAIRPGAVIGAGCKVGGEIGASVVDDHTNKAHGGYLGDSLVGQWCNFGADTNVSNLKNTYGYVRVQLEAEGGAELTDRRFHGPVVGDFVRTAIGTRLLTGAVIGTGCMVALSGFSPKHAPAFGFLTDAGAQRYELEQFLATSRAMLERRGARLTKTEEQVLRELHGGQRPA